MERIQIRISGNGLEARLTAVAGPACSSEHVRSALAKAGVAHGIDEEMITEIARRLTDTQATLDAIVATGDPAEPGSDGRLEGPLLGPREPGEVHGDQTIDYRERHTLQPVAEGQVAARVVAETSGRPGTDVRGHELPSKPGKPAAQQRGEGVRMQGGELIATRGGVVLFTSRKIDVVELYTHSGDIDYESGNLHTEGTLLVKGDVQTGFTAEAQGDVTIAGEVLSARVRAGGSVHVTKGVLGGSSTIRAGENLSCRHATATRLVAGNRIDVQEHAAQSVLRAKRIRVTEGHGAALGGELRAADSIDLLRAGSDAGTTTLLSVGELLDEGAELARRTVHAAKMEREVLRSRRGEARGLMKSRRAAVRAGDEHRAEQIRLRRRQEELLQSAVVRVADALYPGVVIRFGDRELRPNERLHNVEFRFDSENRTIVLGEYDAL